MIREAEHREDVYGLAGWLRAVNQSKGFDTPTPENLLSKEMLVITELDELLEADSWQNHGEELADVWIRLVDVLQAMWPNAWDVRFLASEFAGSVVGISPDEWKTRLEMVWDIVKPLAKAAEAWRKGRDTDVRIGLELALKATVRMAAVTRVHLRNEVTEKISKNEQRDFLHGKVRSS